MNRHLSAIACLILFVAIAAATLQAQSSNRHLRILFSHGVAPVYYPLTDSAEPSPAAWKFEDKVRNWAAQNPDDWCVELGGFLTTDATFESGYSHPIYQFYAEIPYGAVNLTAPDFMVTGGNELGLQAYTGGYDRFTMSNLDANPPGKARFHQSLQLEGGNASVRLLSLASKADTATIPWVHDRIVETSPESVLTKGLANKTVPVIALSDLPTTYNLQLARQFPTLDVIVEIKRHEGSPNLEGKTVLIPVPVEGNLLQFDADVTGDNGLQAIKISSINWGTAEDFAAARKPPVPNLGLSVQQGIAEQFFQINSAQVTVNAFRGMDFGDLTTRSEVLVHQVHTATDDFRFYRLRMVMPPTEPTFDLLVAMNANHTIRTIKSRYTDFPVLTRPSTLATQLPLFYNKPPSEWHLDQAAKPMTGETLKLMGGLLEKVCRLDAKLYP